jgi:Ca2+-binding EF-hand superfamily protein
MNKQRTGFIYYEDFYFVIKSWGFDVCDDLIKELFQWLDFDRDSKISFEDLRQTAGKETNPME